MLVRTYRIPTGEGEVLCDPPLAAWGALLAGRTSEGEPASAAFHLLGEPGSEMARRVRRRLWSEGMTGPVLLTGHQPVFYHAGVWVKAFAVRAAAEATGAFAAHVTVDSDEAREVGLWLPCREGGLTRRWLVLGQPSSLPLEARSAPSRDEWQTFAASGRALLQTLPAPQRDSLLHRWEQFVRAGGDALGESSLARFLVAVRRRLEEEEGGPALPERFVSDIARTPEFLRFFLAWAAEAERLAAEYNAQLAAYRRARRIRSRANPFPDLRRYGDQVETPFWCLGEDQRRTDLFVAGSQLFTRFGRVAQLDFSRPDETVERLMESGPAIRPKAVALTLFLRAFACDLFVHGVGGGRYDHITDGVMRGWWGIEPPRYAVVSASISLDLPAPNLPPEGRPEVWDRRLRDLRYNPQRFARGDGDIAALVEEKEELIRAIAQPGAPKRQLTRRIEAVNAALYDRLSDVRDEMQRARDEADARRREREVATARDYPFFLHPPSRLWAALEPQRRLACCPRG